jgi:hypothetical protein
MKLVHGIQYFGYLACSLPLKTINEILDIECAGGSQLPYSGYIEVNINTPGSTNIFNTYIVLNTGTINLSIQT